MGYRISSLLIASLLAILLAGCGSLEVRSRPGEFLGYDIHATVPSDVSRKLIEAPNCCASLAKLPYRDLNHDSSISSSLDARSPAFNFDTGKSFFAAYRIAGLPRPAMIEVSSFSVISFFLNPAMKGLIFAPVVLVLDKDFQVRRILNPGEPHSGCATNSSSEVYQLHVDITEPSDQAAYLVVLTTQEMLTQDGVNICGIIRHGLSPIGNLTLLVTGIPFDDGQARLRSSWLWFPGADGPKEIGFAESMFKDPGILVEGDKALHFYEWGSGRYSESIRFPHDRIIAAKAMENDRYLNLTLSSDQGNASLHHTFQLYRKSGEPTIPAETMVKQLEPNILPGSYEETLGFFIGEIKPIVEFADYKNGFPSRIGSSAMEVGILTAMPCGICQTGACTPEVLVPCAALFSVGAVIGGVVGLGAEVVASTSNKPRLPTIGKEMKKSFEPKIASARQNLFDRQTLTSCLKNELDKPENSSWIDQGRKGLPTLPEAGSIPAPSTEEFRAVIGKLGLHHGVATFVTRIALALEAKPGQALEEVPAHLIIEGQARSVHVLTKQTEITPLTWKSQTWSLAEWQHPRDGMLEEVMHQGCQALSQQVVESSRKSWIQW